MGPEMTAILMIQFINISVEASLHKEVCCYLQYVKNVQKEQNRSHNIFFLHGGVINMQFRFIPL